MRKKWLVSKIGVSLIGLLIIIVIVGGPLAIATLKFIEFQKKVFQAEAKSNLPHIRTIQFSREIEKRQNGKFRGLEIDRYEMKGDASD